jgi:DNA-binding response OmpR family regulator
MPGERILIVEDEPAVARGLQYGLESEGYEVLVAENGKLALEFSRRKNIQMILLDIRLPDISGFDICRQLRAEGARMPILMVTARDEPIDKVLGLELGADDYVVKPYDLRELIARIRAHIRRAYGDLSDSSKSETIVFGEVVIDMEKLDVTREGVQVTLTPTEFRLLRYLVSNPNRPVSRATLIEAVWGFPGDVGSDRTIDVHIRHLREKLEDDPAKPKWIITVRGMGYKYQAQLGG